MSKDLYTTIFFIQNFREELFNFIGKTTNKDLTRKGIKMFMWFIQWEAITNKKGIYKFLTLLVDIVKDWNINKIEIQQSERLRLFIIKKK